VVIERVSRGEIVEGDQWERLRRKDAGADSDCI
jgi:hypothetical protein